MAALLLAALWQLASATALAAPPTNVVVLHRRGLGVYEAVAQEFRTRLRVPVHVIPIRRHPEISLLGRVRDLRPQLIFAVGQTAYDLARRARLRPLVSTFAYRDRSTVDYFVETQVRPTHVVEALQRLRPSLREITVLTGPNTDWVVAQTELVARRSQIETKALHATTPPEALALLRRLPRSTQALWLLADLATASEQVVQFAISLQFRRRLLLVAPTRTHVRRGALLALDYSPADLAQQAVGAANGLLRHGHRAGRQRELSRWRRRRARWASGVPRLSLNRLTAERIDVAVHRLAERAEVVQ